MGLSRPKWLLFASVCYMSGVHGYSTQRIDGASEGGLEIDYPSAFDTQNFFEESPEDMFNYRSNIESTESSVDSDSTPLDSWSVVWYIASFGGLIVFFLIVSCSEWCCRRAIRNSQSCTRNASAVNPAVPDTPPPSYDQFAPPSYDSILGKQARGGEKNEYDIYVVPVHALGTIMESREDAPPSYLSASANFVPALARLESSQDGRVT